MAEIKKPEQIFVSTSGDMLAVGVISRNEKH